LLPTTSWAEAVSNTCYVQNRVLVTKPDNKTPYELLIGRTPNLGFMKPFECHVTILITLDHLGKFEGKADKGFLIGYSVNSKAFRAVIARNQTNNDASLEKNANAVKAGQEKASNYDYILLPFMPSNTQSSDDKDSGEVPDNGDEDVRKGSRVNDQEKTDNIFKDVNTVEPSINTSSTHINTGSLNINVGGHNDLNMPSLEDTGIFDNAYDDRDVGAEADINNLDLSTVVSPIPTTRVHKDHPKEQIIRDLNLSTQTRKMLNFLKENAMVSYINKQRRTNHKDYQNCLFSCFLSQQEPKKVLQSLANPSWIEAIQEELLQFKL
nr:putative ribonuclease H-like domain-containing protein [Tanacetum cinerariifolium]